MPDQYIEDLADRIADLTSTELWDLATILVENHKVPANLLRADLNFVEKDKV